MKKIITTLLAVFIVFALSACNKPVSPATPSVTVSTPAPVVSDTIPAQTSSPTVPAPASPTTPAFRFTKDNMPVIDGSTATIPLIGAVYSVLLGIPRADADAMVSVSGTDDAYNRLTNGGADILLVYGPSPDTSTDGLDMAPIGRDGLVFLVNKLNPVDSLTPDQIVGIYSGKTTNWKDAGGQDVEIKAFQRQLLSGSQTMMDALVMKGVPMMDAPAQYVIGEMGGLVDAIANYDNAESAIGYNVYYFVSQMAMDPNVKLLNIGGVAPSVASISDGTYPFVADFYAVIRSDEPADSPARILYNWIQSSDGQNLVKNEGYATAG